MKSTAQKTQMSKHVAAFSRSFVSTMREGRVTVGPRATPNCSEGCAAALGQNPVMKHKPPSSLRSLRVRVQCSDVRIA